MPKATKPLWYQSGVMRTETTNRIRNQRDANFLLVMGHRRSPVIWVALCANPACSVARRNSSPEILQAVTSWPRHDSRQHGARIWPRC